MQNLLIGIGGGGTNYLVNTQNQLPSYDRWLFTDVDFIYQPKAEVLNFDKKSDFLTSGLISRLKQYDQIFIVCCLGGAYGGYWLEALLETCCKISPDLYVWLMKPFQFEGNIRALKTDYLIALTEKTQCNDIFIYSNEDMKALYGADVRMRDAFNHSYDVFVKDVLSQSKDTQSYNNLMDYSSAKGLGRDTLITNSYEMVNQDGLLVKVLVCTSDEIVFRYHYGPIVVLYSSPKDQFEEVYDGDAKALWDAAIDIGDGNSKLLKIDDIPQPEPFKRQETTQVGRIVGHWFKRLISILRPQHTHKENI